MRKSRKFSRNTILVEKYGLGVTALRTKKESSDNGRPVIVRECRWHSLKIMWNTEDSAQLEFESLCRKYKLQPSDYGRTFLDENNLLFQIVGIKASNRKFRIIASTVRNIEDRKKFQVSFVLEQLHAQRPVECYLSPIDANCFSCDSSLVEHTRLGKSLLHAREWVQLWRLLRQDYCQHPGVNCCLV